MNKYNYPIGSVSSGTMRSQDLFEAFTSELHCADPKRYEAFARDHADAFGSEDCDDYDNMSPDQEEALDFAVQELFDILNEFAGPYFYFGAQEGNVSDYGFWFDQESFDEATFAGEVLKVKDLSEVKFPISPNNRDYVAVFSDHGNVTLYDCNGQEVWAIV